ncbi:MAG: queuosine precursor transporter [Leptospiraceae bacterium]|nr:queuosine precursor transporter [Leptospiraceae bacterium]
MEYRERVFLILSAIFISSLVMANLIGITKIFSFFGIGIPVGIIPYPITFLATDLISELYGKKRASFVVWVGFMMNIFMLLVTTIGYYMPVDPEWFNAIAKLPEPGKENTFNYIYGYMIRGTIASMIAYLVAQMVDVHLFHFWKELTKGKHLWLRNNGSTMLSQIVDTVAVMSITFVGLLPMEKVIELILYSYLFKFIVALLDTPFFYLGVKLLKDRVEVET